MRKLKITLLFFLLTAILRAQEQKPAFWDDIQAFKKKDSISFPPKKGILFIGSSSFTRWQDVQDYFPRHTIINRGFGGSTLPDVIRYVPDIVFPYQPKQVVIYCGENDLASSEAVTGQIVFERFRELFQLIRDRFPRVSIVYVSMKPSPSRVHLFPKMREGNRLIREFLSGKKRTAYVDVYTKMLRPDGAPMEDIFKEDNLHMNEKGYLIWQTAIEPYLKK